jgi:hypothetical protein
MTRWLVGVVSAMAGAAVASVLLAHDGSAEAKAAAATETRAAAPAAEPAVEPWQSEAWAKNQEVTFRDGDVVYRKDGSDAYQQAVDMCARLGNRQPILREEDGQTVHFCCAPSTSNVAPCDRPVQ